MLEPMSNRTPLERVMNERRLKLGMRWRDVLSAADNLSAETLRRVRLHGTGVVDDFTIARIEKALRLDSGGLKEMERRADGGEEGTDPLTAPARVWGAELVGPEGVVDEGEVLMWRDTPTGRLYRLADAEDTRVHTEYEFPPGEAPEQVIDDLRGLLYPHRANVHQMERRRARR